MSRQSEALMEPQGDVCEECSEPMEWEPNDEEMVCSNERLCLAQIEKSERRKVRRETGDRG